MVAGLVMMIVGSFSDGNNEETFRRAIIALLSLRVSVAYECVSGQDLELLADLKKWDVSRNHTSLRNACPVVLFQDLDLF